MIVHSLTRTFQTIQPADQRLRKQYFQTLLEAAFPLMKGPDSELALDALIDAVGMLQEHLGSELQELRQGQVE